MGQVIVGMTHQDHLYPRIMEFLAQRFPSASSAMLEIPPDWREYRGFFPDMARYLEQRGAKIIAGDLKYWGVFEHAQSSGLERLVKADKELKVMARVVDAAMDGRLLKDRNESMNEVYRQERPELTIIGARHGKFLKQMNPDAHFIYLSSNNLVQGVAGSDIQWLADETIRFPQCWEDFIYQWLGLASMGAGLVLGAEMLPGPAAVIAPVAYASYCSAQAMKSSREKESGKKIAEGCGGFIGGSITGAAVFGAAYLAGVALSQVL